MNDLTVSLSGAQLWNKSRSIGMKLIVICGLALLMVIPSFFVADLVEDRTKREADVIKEISNHVGGQQTFVMNCGPALSNGSRRTPFIERPARRREPDRERTNWRARCPGHTCHDRAGIEASAQKRAHRYVGH